MSTDESGSLARDSTFVTRVVLKNYKSISACDVRLGPLAILVGPNGSGKSNFLDALRFVADGLRYGLDQALRERGGIAEVRRRSKGHPTHFEIRLELRSEEGGGLYAFTIGSQKPVGYVVQHELCEVYGADGRRLARFEVEAGAVNSTESVMPVPSPDLLYLVRAAGVPAFQNLFARLSRMGFYNLSPKSIRDPQDPDSGDVLLRDGANLASVLHRLQRQNPRVKERVLQYLRVVVPGVAGVERRSLGPKEMLEFSQEVQGDPGQWRFSATSMSDGTLRALGILTALLQASGEGHPRIPLVGVEEPEAALHPAAAGLLFDCLREASEDTQVLVTSHSSDLLDRDDVDPDSLRSVQNVRGMTLIGGIDPASREALWGRLCTAGELLRQDYLKPNRDDLPASVSRQLTLKGAEEW